MRQVIKRVNSGLPQRLPFGISLVSGTSFDLFGVRGVSVTIKETIGLYWNGTSTFTSATPQWSAAVGASSWSERKR